MKKPILGLGMLPFLAVPSMAASQLSDQQMDRVIAGFDYLSFRSTDTAIVAINEHLDINITSFLNVAVTSHLNGLLWLRVLGFSIPPPP